MIKLAITMGDPAGIGPEIIIKALSGASPEPDCLPVVVGSTAILIKTARALNKDVKIIPCNIAPHSIPAKGEIFVMEPQRLPDLEKIYPGRICNEAGAAAHLFIEFAVRLIQNGAMDALCTAPVHKEAMKAAGFSFPGHTEYLAHLSGTDEFGMLMSGGGLRVALLTIHTALKNVPKKVTKEAILKKLHLMDSFLPYFGLGKPHIAVCGLNPHSGEGGMFGEEEKDVISPAIIQAVSEGIKAEGPYPADTVYYRMLQGDFDAVLAMYHDQALIPVKTLAFHNGVNITMGLPFIRSSVDHGTGFDIAGKGVARSDSLRAAIRNAVLLSGNKIMLEKEKPGNR